MRFEVQNLGLGLGFRVEGPVGGLTRIEVDVEPQACDREMVYSPRSGRGLCAPDFRWNQVILLPEVVLFGTEILDMDRLTKALVAAIAKWMCWVIIIATVILQNNSNS